MFAGALLIGLLTSPARAAVIDQAGLFSRDVVEKANRRINLVRDRVKKDLVVETFSEIPEKRRKDLKENAPKEERAKFFDRWARDRAEDLKVNGVYILILKSPGRLEIKGGKDTLNKGFPEDGRKALGRKMLTLLDDKKYDAALEEAVSRVTDSYESNARKKPAESRREEQTKKAASGGGFFSGIGGWICIGLVAVLGIWVLLGVVRGLSGGGGGYGGGGGGFFSSLLGGMFGAAAGMWMYNSFFGGSSASAAPPMGSDSSSPYGTDTDYSGDGGDFGDGGDAGGGDFDGGGDFGGGDFGGGDF
jgi:uncharacterized protein